MAATAPSRIGSAERTDELREQLAAVLGSRVPIAGRDETKVAFTGRVRQWPKVREIVPQAEPAAEAFPVEHETVLSFAERRRMFAGASHRRRHVPRETPQEFLMLDACLQLPVAGAETAPIAQQTFDDSVAVSANSIEVIVNRLGGSRLSYSVPFDETTTGLKLRIANDLGINVLMIALLLEDASCELSTDIAVSAYCTSGDGIVVLTLVVSIRDACRLASRGDLEAGSKEGLKVLLDNAERGDSMAIAAAHACIRNSDWHSPLILPALKLLSRVLPQESACAFFAACVACGPEMVRSYGGEVIHEIEAEHGFEFVFASLATCIGKRWEADEVIDYVRTLSRNLLP